MLCTPAMLPAGNAFGPVLVCWSLGVGYARAHTAYVVGVVSSCVQCAMTHVTCRTCATATCATAPGEPRTLLTGQPALRVVITSSPHDNGPGCNSRHIIVCVSVAAVSWYLAGAASGGEAAPSSHLHTPAHPVSPTAYPNCQHSCNARNHHTRRHFGCESTQRHYGRCAARSADHAPAAAEAAVRTYRTVTAYCTRQYRRSHRHGRPAGPWQICCCCCCHRDQASLPRAGAIWSRGTSRGPNRWGS